MEYVVDLGLAAWLCYLTWRQAHLHADIHAPKPEPELSEVARAIVRHQLGTQTTPGRARLRARIESIRERKAQREAQG